MSLARPASSVCKASGAPSPPETGRGRTRAAASGGRHSPRAPHTRPGSCIFNPRCHRRKGSVSVLQMRKLRHEAVGTLFQSQCMESRNPKPSSLTSSRPPQGPCRSESVAGGSGNPREPPGAPGNPRPSHAHACAARQARPGSPASVHGPDPRPAPPDLRLPARTDRRAVTLVGGEGGLAGGNLARLRRAAPCSLPKRRLCPQ